MEAELERWLANGFVRRLHGSEIASARCVSPAFVSHVRSKPRLVIDLRDVNELLEDKPFKYESLPEFIASLVPDDHLVSWDIKDAYHHLFVHPSDYPYLVFTINAAYYQIITMPFGLSIAPWAWTKVMRPVLAHLRSLGFTLIGYVDDHGAAPPGPRPSTRSSAAAGFRLVARLMDRLGLHLHPEKGDREGTQSLELLGFVIHTALNRVYITEKRRAKVAGAAMALLASASNHRRFVRLKPLQRMAGLAVSTMLAIPEARLYTRSLYDDLRPAMDGQSDRIDRRLSHQSIRDLRFWASLAPTPSVGRRLWAPPSVGTLHTDASDTGWGGGLHVDGARRSARGLFTATEGNLHINVKEVLAVRLSLLSFAAFLPQGCTVELFCDSKVALHVIEALSSRSAPLLAELRRLHALLRERDVTLLAEWLPTAENGWADALSREEDRTNWTLERPFFTALEALYGPHDVDRFATMNNTQLTRYNSRHYDPGTEAVNALEQDWSLDNNWANPPFGVIPLVLQLLAAQSASATVIAPVWTAQPWWQPALDQANEVVYLPRSAGIQHGAMAPTSDHPHWRVCALRFTGGGRPRPPARGPGQPTPPVTRRLGRAPVVALPPSC